MPAERGKCVRWTMRVTSVSSEGSEAYNLHLQAAGVSDSLVRFAFGVEDTEDLVKDVEQALGKLSLLLKK